MFIAFVVPMVLLFIRSHHFGIEHEQEAAQMLYEKQVVVMHTIGLGSMFYILIGALGIIYAFTKFSSGKNTFLLPYGLIALLTYKKKK